MACNLLEVYCKEQDTELLKDFYYQDDRRIDSANVVLSEGFSELVMVLFRTTRKRDS